ncbi:MAG TPA: DUF642 domain-containing protein [Mycobacteriales bacterium]|jgi:hypothetical protein|nr:DUF642 domain-containing protein [Mycobacteriales bacterium]
MKGLLKRVITTGVGAGAVVLASLTAGPLAAATTVTATEFGNPGFESPDISGASLSYVNYTAPSTAIDNWTVTAGDVDLVMAPYPVHSGTQALDLNGFGPGTIAQTFAVHPGLHYSIKYWVNVNTGGNDWNIDVSSNGTSIANGNGDYSNPTGADMFDGAWQRWGPGDVVPTGTTMTVTLTSLDSGAGGVILDDFAVTYSDPGPDVSDLAVASGGAKVHLTGTVANGAIGQGDVTGAQYRLIRGTYVGPWVPMAATDGAFDEPSEAVFADIALPRYVGSYDIDVRGIDELGNYTDVYGHLTNAFTVNVVASGPIVANSTTTANSATDKAEPDFVVDAVAGMVGTVPVGTVDINYKNMTPVHFVPAGTAPYLFTGYGSTDLYAWHSDVVNAVSIQFLAAGMLSQYPRGGFYISAPSQYMLPTTTLSQWAPGVPFDRGSVVVWH